MSDHNPEPAIPSDAAAPAGLYGSSLYAATLAAIEAALADAPDVAAEGDALPAMEG